MREKNYDILRMVCCFAVVMSHVSGVFFDANIEYIKTGGAFEDLNMPYASCVFHSLTRFAVPCFIMLSGAFVLDNQDTKNYKLFYEKFWNKIGIHIVVFTIIYAVYKIPTIFIGNITGLDGLIELFVRLITGNIMFHMWYIYMLIELYFLASVLKNIIDGIHMDCLYKFSIGFFLLSCISRYTTVGSATLSYDVGQTFECFSFFLLGYCIRKNVMLKHNEKALFFIIIATVLLIWVSFFEYNQIINGINEQELQYKIASTWSPIMVLASVFIFYAFTNININNTSTKSIQEIVKMSFYIYLIHAGVWDILSRMTQMFNPSFFIKFNPVIGIIGFSCLVFIVSWILSLLYNRVFTWIMNHKIRTN